MGIVELFEIGFFTAFINWSNSLLTVLVYAFVIVGGVIQIILSNKCRNPIMKWSLMGLCGVGIMICECLWQTITGWDRIAVDFVYGFIICLLLGAVITAIISAIKSRR